MIMRKDFTITKEQINEYIEQHPCCGATKQTLHDLFPDAFKKELVSGWVKHKDGMHTDWLWYVNFETNEDYGFMANGEWSDTAKDQLEYVKGRCEQATESEVLEALKNEAIKRYPVGCYVKCIANTFLSKPDAVCEDKENRSFMSNGSLWISANGSVNICVFRDGKWAEIIHTITKSEAEKQLGMKIID